MNDSIILNKKQNDMSTGRLSSNELREKYIRIYHIESYFGMINSQIQFFEETRGLGKGKEAVHEMIVTKSNNAVVVPMRSLVQHEPIFLESFDELKSSESIDVYFKDLQLVMDSLKKSVLYPIPDRHPPLLNWQLVVMSVRSLAVDMPVEQRTQFEEAGLVAFMHYEWRDIENFVRINEVFLEEI